MNANDRASSTMWLDSSRHRSHLDIRDLSPHEDNFMQLFFQIIEDNKAQVQCKFFVNGVCTELVRWLSPSVVVLPTSIVLGFVRHTVRTHTFPWSCANTDNSSRSYPSLSCSHNAEETGTSASKQRQRRCRRPTARGSVMKCKLSHWQLLQRMQQLKWF